MENWTELAQLLDLPADPPTAGWMMAPDFMLELAKLISEVKPNLAVELGSGFSTAVLAKAVQKVGGRLVSLEHDEHYLQLTKQALADYRATADVRHAPLVSVHIEDGDWKWYDRAAWGDLQDIDLLIVDGPPGKTGPLARYPALPLLATSLSPDARIILDDTERSEEQEIIVKWMKVHPNLKRRDIEHSRGVSTILRAE